MRRELRTGSAAEAWKALSRPTRTEGCTGVTHSAAATDRRTREESRRTDHWVSPALIQQGDCVRVHARARACVLR